MIKLNAKQLRKGIGYKQSFPPAGAGRRVQGIVKKKIKKNEIYIVLDNVLDTYNIGSIFRLADAVAAKKVYLCGTTEIPPNTRIKKASINTTEWVEWEYVETAVEAIEKCKGMSAKGEVKNTKDLSLNTLHSALLTVAIEQSKNSVQYNKFDYKLPICLIVGNETNGISKEVLKMADAIVELPMFGVNKSLNVMVSLGIVVYEVIKRQ